MGQVIRRSAAILRALEEHPSGCSVAEVADAVDLPRSTVHRVLKALEEEHLVSSAAGGTGFRLGPALMHMASTANSWLVESVRPFLADLAKSVDETVDLAVLSRDEVYFVDQVLSDHRLQAVSDAGLSFPACNTANGKALLADLDDDAVRSLLANAVTKPKDIDALLAELAVVRETGVAFDRQEHHVGISAVGTSLPNPFGMAVALSVPSPTARFIERETEIVAKLIEGRDRISKHLRNA